MECRARVRTYPTGLRASTGFVQRSCVSREDMHDDPVWTQHGPDEVHRRDVGVGVGVDGPGQRGGDRAPLLGGSDEGKATSGEEVDAAIDATLHYKSETNHGSGRSSIIEFLARALGTLSVIYGDIGESEGRDRERVLSRVSMHFFDSSRPISPARWPLAYARLEHREISQELVLFIHFQRPG